MIGGDIYVHDARLLRVIEDAATDTLTMEVDLPQDEWSDELVPRVLVFADAYAYQVYEGPFLGCPAILDMTVVGQSGEWSRVRLNTSAGYRELYCKSVRVADRASVA
ncbi:MAG TPA: hypothetical protein VF669_09300 [Tepidisphaeraceae bacterium]|jgi:hypothetical protein